MNYLCNATLAQNRFALTYTLTQTQNFLLMICIWLRLFDYMVDAKALSQLAFNDRWYMWVMVRYDYYIVSGTAVSMTIYTVWFKVKS